MSALDELLESNGNPVRFFEHIAQAREEVANLRQKVYAANDFRDRLKEIKLDQFIAEIKSLRDQLHQAHAQIAVLQDGDQ